MRGGKQLASGIPLLTAGLWSSFRESFDGHTFITYDDEESVRLKCEYLKKEGLAGIMFWEYGCDTTLSLLNAIHEGLGSSKRQAD